jgi:hypothetical protein
MAALTPELVAAHLKLDPHVISALRAKKSPIV